MTTPREAAEKAFHECEGNTAQSLKAAFDAYEAAKAATDEIEAVAHRDIAADRADAYREGMRA